MANSDVQTTTKDDLVDYKEKLAQLEKETLEQINDLLKQEEKRKAEIIVKDIRQKI